MVISLSRSKKNGFDMGFIKMQTEIEVMKIQNFLTVVNVKESFSSLPVPIGANL